MGCVAALRGLQAELQVVVLQMHLDAATLIGRASQISDKRFYFSFVLEAMACLQTYAVSQHACEWHSSPTAMDLILLVSVSISAFLKAS